MSLKHYKDKEYGREYREQYKTEYRKRTGSGKRGGRLWTAQELRRVLEHSIPDVELAEELDRSVLAIQIKRCRMRDREEN